MLSIVSILDKQYNFILTSNDVDTDDITRQDDVDKTTNKNIEQQSLREKLSNMELENNLLRGEVKLLNTELAEVNKRMKEMQECKQI